MRSVIYMSLKVVVSLDDKSDKENSTLCRKVEENKSELTRVEKFAIFK
jgi:hypothetical protein